MSGLLVQPTGRTLLEADALVASRVTLTMAPPDAALESAVDVLDRLPAADVDGAVRLQIENALQMLLRRIWPYLDELDEQD